MSKLIFDYNDGDLLEVFYQEATYSADPSLRFKITDDSDDAYSYVWVPNDCARELRDKLIESFPLPETNEENTVTEVKTELSDVDRRHDALKRAAEILGRPGNGFLSTGTPNVNDLFRLAKFISDGTVLNEDLI